MTDLNIAIVGAGVVGLTTAIEVKKQFRNANVSVIAEKFETDTTSYVAAGLFRPGTSFSGPNEQITRRWINDAFEHWDALRITEDAPKAGVTQVAGYIFSSTHESIVRNSYIEKLVPLYRPATEEELNLCPGNWKYGSFFATVLVECALYLPWATEQLNRAGAKITRHTINSFSELTDFDVIINCAGLGAKYLCQDKKLVPMRGQVLKVRAPWVKTFFYADYDTYIIPGFESVTLGGVRQYDSFDLNVNRYDGLAIRERCEALLPSLKTASLLDQRVGLRPHRDPVRVEPEIRNVNGKRLRIVHQYGHGGYGVTTAPGTAKYAVSLVKQVLSGSSKL